MPSTRSHRHLASKFLIWFAMVCGLGLTALFAVVQRMPQQVAQARSGDEMLGFVRRVLASTEDVWDRLFASAGATYEKPKLVILSGSVPSACGTGLAASGPFYCPLDRRLYLDFEFFDQLARRHGARGDFAQIYVIAHEVAHHVQTLLGIEQRVHAFDSALRVSRPIRCWFGLNFKRIVLLGYGHQWFRIAWDSAIWRKPLQRRKPSVTTP